MRSVSIAELKDQLSGYLQDVLNGEEIIIEDETVPVARILPIHRSPAWPQQTHLLPSNALRPPQQEVNWERFFDDPAGSVPHEVAVQATIDSRGGR